MANIETLPKAAALSETIDGTYATILKKWKSGNPDESYVAKLKSRGRKKICQKVGEEAVEVVIDAVADRKKDTIDESADLLFHLMVLWADMGITPQDVARELENRKGISGIEAKAKRTKK